MDKRSQGAWLLSQSKILDDVTGAFRFENIAYAGKIGRLYNVLRRKIIDDPTPRIEVETVNDLCKLNNIDIATRREGLRLLQAEGRLEKEGDGSVVIFGATTRDVLETTSSVFETCNPTQDERAVLDLSQQISGRPIERSEAEEYIGDTHKLTRAQASSLVDVSKDACLVDQEKTKDRIILFNANMFRDRDRVRKTYYVLESLKESEKALVTEADELLRRQGAVYEADIEKMLGPELYRRLVSIGYFDRMEVNNTSEATGYLALPDAFQKYGRPFEEDPVDDAKALLASLTYGMQRSTYTRGQITLPTKLLNKLIEGGTVGDQKPVAAIGEDYRELEKRGVVKVIPAGYGRYSMKLLKPDVGELALAIVSGRNASEESLLMGTRAATGFKGPEENRRQVRQKNTVEDRRFITSTLDRIRGGED